MIQELCYYFNIRAKQIELGLGHKQEKDRGHLSLKVVNMTLKW